MVAYLDAGHPSHKETEFLAQRGVALNPTVIHEAYHTLVFKMKWAAEEASRTLVAACTDEDNLFINQTLRRVRAGLKIGAEHHELGGRDALILGNLLIGKVGELITFDKELLALGKIKFGRSAITIRRP